MKKEKSKIDTEKYFADPEQNAAFICCVNILTELIEKYGDKVIATISRDLASNIRCDYIFFTQNMKGLCEIEKVGYMEILKSYVQIVLVERKIKCA